MIAPNNNRHVLSADAPDPDMMTDTKGCLELFKSFDDIFAKAARGDVVVVRTQNQLKAAQGYAEGKCPEMELNFEVAGVE